MVKFPCLIFRNKFGTFSSSKGRLPESNAYLSPSLHMPLADPCRLQQGKYSPSGLVIAQLRGKGNLQRAQILFESIQTCPQPCTKMRGQYYAAAPDVDLKTVI